MEPASKDLPTNAGSYNFEFRMCRTSECQGPVVFAAGEAVGPLDPNDWASAACPLCGTVQSLTCAALGKPLRRQSTAAMSCDSPVPQPHFASC